MKHIEDAAEFRKMTNTSMRPIIVIFHSENCVACRHMEQVIAEIEYIYEDLMDFVSVDITNLSELASDYYVNSVPLVLCVWQKSVTVLCSGVVQSAAFRLLLDELFQKGP